MILVDKDTVETEGQLGEIHAELACAILGVFDAVNNHCDENSASEVVRSAISAAVEEIKEDYGVDLFNNSSSNPVVSVQVIKVPKDCTSIADILKAAEHYRKEKQGADTNAKPTE